MKSKQSKHNQIKAHLEKGWFISGRSALSIYGVYRLSSVINRLRNEGIKIKTTLMDIDNHAIYSIID